MKAPPKHKPKKVLASKKVEQAGGRLFPVGRNDGSVIWYGKLNEHASHGPVKEDVAEELLKQA